MPYGELGSVDRFTSCGCFHSFSTDLSPATPGGGGGISPGCGCEGGLVEEIVTELKIRMKSRGDTGTIIRAEQTLVAVNDMRKEIDVLREQLDAVVKHLGVVVPVRQVVER
jgi:hypothetical protein